MTTSLPHHTPPAWNIVPESHLPARDSRKCNIDLCRKGVWPRQAGSLAGFPRSRSQTCSPILFLLIHLQFYFLLNRQWQLLNSSISYSTPVESVGHCLIQEIQCHFFQMDCHLLIVWSFPIQWDSHQFGISTGTGPVVCYAHSLRRPESSSETWISSPQSEVGAGLEQLSSDARQHV